MYDSLRVCVYVCEYINIYVCKSSLYISLHCMYEYLSKYIHTHVSKVPLFFVVFPSFPMICDFLAIVLVSAVSLFWKMAIYKVVVDLL